MVDLQEKYNRAGFCMLKGALSASEVHAMIDATAGLRKHDQSHGIRNLINRIPEVRKLLDSPIICHLVKTILGDHARPVRSIYFDKNRQANWNVAWHQDTTIAVTNKAYLPGFGPWSEKDRIIHVEPPEYVLNGILTLRIHLDRTDENNGALRVIPKSHLYGRVKSKHLLELVACHAVVHCVAQPGDILMMNPLIFHASRKSQYPEHRRILHIEYANTRLPEAIDWYESGRHEIKES